LLASPPTVHVLGVAPPLSLAGMREEGLFCPATDTQVLSFGQSTDEPFDAQGY
jgi:hypothetical protein